MKIEPFELERWQSVWENRIELNISESGVHPLTPRELLAGDDAALDGLLDVRLGYPQTNGSEELRGRIAALYSSAKAPAGPENVLVTCGCSEANYVVSWSLLEPGGEVILMLPNYMQVAGIVPAYGAVVKPWWLREELNWAPDFEELRKLVTPKTRLIAVCNPNNPTGAVLSEKLMGEICCLAAGAGAYVLADEVYRGAEFDAALTPSFWGRYERAICTGGMSKAFGMPGLRMGWVVAQPQLAEQLWSYHDYTSIGPAMLSDRLASLALEPARFARIRERTRGILRANYPLVRDWVARHSGRLTHVPPAAGAIAWAGYTGNRKSSEIAETLRDKKGVLIVPGSQFDLEGYIRIGFGGDASQLQAALARVDEVLFEGSAAVAG